MPLLKCPVAVNASVCPAGIEVVVAVIEMDCKTGAVTVKTVIGLVTSLEVAVMLVVPAATPVATPPLAMVATAVLEELQVTLVVRF